MATLLEMVNIGLRLVGQQEILNTNSTLGTLAKTTLQTAVDVVISETRHASTQTFTDTTVTQTDYSQPGTTVPIRCLQVIQVFGRQGTNNWIELQHSDFEHLAVRTAHYNIIGNNIYFSKAIERPFTVRVLGITGVDILSLADGAQVTVSVELEPAIWYTMASLLAVSFVDDPNNASMHGRMAETHIKRIRDRRGLMASPSVKWRMA